MDEVLRLLHLLANRVRLAGSVDVARQDQNRNAVSGCGCSSGNHVQAPGNLYTEEVQAKMDLRRICFA